MTKQEAAMIRWLAQIYAARGHVPDAHWAQFAQFIADHDIYCEPPMGQRRDGANPWDVLEIQLREQDIADFECNPQRALIREAWDGKKYNKITAIHRDDPPAQLVDQ